MSDLVRAPTEMNAYRSALKQAMEMLAQDDRVIFLGQTVGRPGSRFTYCTLEDIHPDKRIELPVMEESQMGISTGLALAGYIPVTIYPRMDFLTLATNQLVNHLDKLPEMSRGQFKPKVIIRVIVGAREPIYPGPQHCQDHTEAFRIMLTTVDVVQLTDHREIVPAYRKALNSDKSTLLAEIGDLHFKYNHDKL